MSTQSERICASMFIVLVLALISSGPAKGESLPTIKDLEKKELEQLNVEGTLWGEVQNAGNKIRFSCLKAFPDESYCNCLGEKLPLSLTFPQFVAVVSTTKRDLGYATLTSDGMKLIDIARSVRETCVSAMRP